MVASAPMNPSAPSAPPAGPTRSASNPAGIVSLIGGILVVLLSILSQGVNLLVPLVSYRYDMNPAHLVLLTAVPIVLVALVTVVVGIIGIVQRDRPRGAAIAGTAIGAAHLAVIVGGWTLNLILSAVVR